MPRYTVRTDNIPAQLKVRFFVAWVNDAQHPDDPDNGASISWHMSYEDARDVCAALNANAIAEPASLEYTYRGAFDQFEIVAPDGALVDWPRLNTKEDAIRDCLEFNRDMGRSADAISEARWQARMGGDLEA